MEYSSDSKYSDMIVLAGGSKSKPEEDDQPVPLIQAEVNCLTRDLTLSNVSAQLLGSSLTKEISVGTNDKVLLFEIVRKN